MMRVKSSGGAHVAHKRAVPDAPELDFELGAAAGGPRTTAARVAVCVSARSARRGFGCSSLLLILLFALLLLRRALVRLSSRLRHDKARHGWFHLYGARC